MVVWRFRGPVYLLVGCQANYIRDVQGGTVAPSSSSKLTGISVQ
ncbi:TPA: colicin release lysis protein [Escherichia coli]